MGSRGPLPKRDGRKVPRDQTIVKFKAVPGGLIAAPAPDEAWADEVKALWEHYWQSGLIEVVLKPDLEAVWQLFDCYDLYRRYSAQIREEPTVEHRGDVRLHPLTMERHRLLGQMRVIERSLGILPLARHSLKITVGRATLTAAEINERSRNRSRDRHEAERQPRVTGGVRGS